MCAESPVFFAVLDGMLLPLYTCLAMAFDRKTALQADAGRPVVARFVDAFVMQQPDLFLDAGRIASDRTVGADDAVRGDDDRKGIAKGRAVQRHFAHRTFRAEQTADARPQLAAGDDLAVGNAQ